MDSDGTYEEKKCRTASVLTTEFYIDLTHKTCEPVVVVANKRNFDFVFPNGRVICIDQHVGSGWNQQLPGAKLYSQKGILLRRVFFPASFDDGRILEYKRHFYKIEVKRGEGVSADNMFFLKQKHE